ncbi:hypothetical protein [Thiocystis violacea]|uniref:hypothetical protein n=1 Tax=Thiocystis violacea TaxID=13725 RepID=UPI001905BD80|nr:hypothetical protein [Thiocystis violacea]
MQVVQEQLKQCNVCNRQTLHQRNNKQMSWVMHLVLAIFTLGAWLLIWLLIAIWHILTKPIGARWICSVCGQKESATPTFDRMFATDKSKPPRNLRAEPKTRETAKATPPAPPKPKVSAVIQAPRPIPGQPELLLPVQAQHENDIIRCSNPGCGRLLPLASATCVHCGTVHS